MGKHSRELNEKIAIEVKQLMQLDPCQLRVVLIERFRSEYLLRQDLHRMLRAQSKTQLHLMDDYYNRKF